MLPDPTFSFSIPSLNDDIALDCRVYNPSYDILDSDESLWNPRGAIIAHPYAPLGGCYDDPVVHAAGAELLKEGGAGTSKGRTTWQARAELEDYISFVGFFTCYVEDLQAALDSVHSLTTWSPTLRPIESADRLPSSPIDQGRQGTLLILGGYSYGGLITIQLPVIEEILHRFDTSLKGSAVTEIRLRARNLAAQWTKDAKHYREAEDVRTSRDRLKPSASNMVVIGGDESEHGSRRPSSEGRMGLHAVRRSMERSRQRLGLRRHSHSSDISSCTATEKGLAAPEVAPPRTCYLLISPPLAPLSLLVTMFSSIHSARLLDLEERSIHHAICAIYGDSDFFTSQRKYRKWTENLKRKQGSQFQSEEIPGAGHFYREEGAIEHLRSAIVDWVHDL